MATRLSILPLFEVSIRSIGFHDRKEGEYSACLLREHLSRRSLPSCNLFSLVRFSRSISKDIFLAGIQFFTFCFLSILVMILCLSEIYYFIRDLIIMKNCVTLITMVTLVLKTVTIKMNYITSIFDLFS